MAKLKLPHEGHERHLCFLQNVGYFMVDYKELVKDPKFMCKKCGRAAVKKEYLCEPEKL